MLEKIKQALGEELAEQVEAKLKEAKVELGITNNGSLVGADKHDTMKAEHKATLEQMEALQGQLKTLEGSEGTAEELKEALKAKGEEFEQFKADTIKRETTLTKTQAIAKALDTAGAIKSSIDLLVPTFDLDKVQLDSKGNIVDLDEIINPIKEARAELFVTKQLDSDPPAKGDGITDDDDLDDQAFFDKQTKKEK